MMEEIKNEIIKVYNEEYYPGIENAEYLLDDIFEILDKYNSQVNTYKTMWEELFREIENNGSDSRWNAETQDWYLDKMEELEQKHIRGDK